MGAKKQSKKKGPRGKKARAKAKLDQVWGEHVDDSVRAAGKVRVGKSRHLHSQGRGEESKQALKRNEEVDPLYERRRGVKSAFDRFLERKATEGTAGGIGAAGRPRREKRREETHASSSDEDSGSDDEIKDGNAGLTTLLKRIGGSKGAHGMAVDSDDKGAENSESEASDGDDVGMEQSDSDDDNDEGESQPSQGDDDDDNTGAMAHASAAEDPYDAHFSKPSLPQVESTTQLVPHVGNVRKVPTASLLGKSVEVSLAGPLLDAWDGIAANADGAAANGVMSKKEEQRAWEAFALGPYRHVRQAIGKNWRGCNKSAAKRRTPDDNGTNGHGETNVGKIFSRLQLALYPAVARYADVLLTAETRANRTEVRNLTAMHILNHVLTSRARVQRHNRRIKELAQGEGKESNAAATEGAEDRWRDQGYARPKVLVLLPTRGTCWTFVKQMVRLLGDAAMVDNDARFDEEYGPLDPEAVAEGDDDDDAKRARRAAVLKQKGAEWNDLFGDAINADDDFKMGISVTPNVVKAKGKKRAKHAGNGAAGAAGVNVKLFAEYYRSDILVASPIGLKMAITKDEGEGEEGESEADVDFLSSIDVCLVDRADVLLMQNWDHVNAILDAINRQPTKVADIDFSRVRNYFLDGQGVHWRQLIMVSQFADPYILSTFRRHAKNVEGQLRVRTKVAPDDASVCDVLVRARQVFQRVACPAAAEAGSHRLRYFADHVLPKLTRLKQKHTLIYIPSYFDYVAVRNLLLKREVKFVSVTEYARVSEVSRGRARFLQGLKPIMLYTGRAHFFLRHAIKGARHVIFFGLPEYPEFYPAVANMLNDGPTNVDEDDDVSRAPRSCLSLYTKFDAHQLERIVGTAHAGRMIKGEKSSFMFCS